MKYTEFNQKEYEDYEYKFRNRKVKLEEVKADCSLFVYHCLGMKPYIYQDRVLNDPSKRVMICSSRQIGKTQLVSWKALHTILFNPETKFIIISKTLPQAKKVINGIRDLIYKGDKIMKEKMGVNNLFSSKIDVDKPNNTDTITLKNSSVIKSLPATDAARGETADYLYVDEAAFVEDEIFDAVLKPLVLATGGHIILSSTPNGHKGFFFKLFDPHEKQLSHEYKRYWFPWSVCPNPNVRKQVIDDKKTMEGIIWTQEYEATFETTMSSYFENPQIDAAINYDLSEEHDWKTGETYMGVDWGYKDCHTVISIVAHIPETKKVRLIYQYEFASGADNRDAVRMIETLCKSFKVGKVYSDDCGLADPYNKDMEEKGEIPLYRFDFNKDKGKSFAHFKDLLASNRFEMPNNRQLIEQMKSMVFERTANGHLKIHAPQNYYDDRVDSLVMACWQAETEEAISLILV